MANRERVEFDVVGRDSGGSKTFRQVGDAAEKAADQIEGLGEASAKAGDEAEGLGDKVKGSGDKTEDTTEKYRGLAHEIEAVEGNVRRLAAEIDRTGNKDLFKDLRKQQSELRKLSRAKDLLPKIEPAEMAKVGAQAGEAFSGGFRGFLTSGPGLAIGAAVAVPVVATLGAAVSGAIVGGVGAGGVVGGLALAAQDSRVQAAGKGLADSVMGDLEDSATRFVGPAIQGVGIIRSAWSDVADDVDAVFAATSRYVEPLARGVADFVREIAPGVRDAAEAAGPIMDVIREDLPGLGRELSDLLSTVADHADEGASAIHLIFMGVEDTIASVSALIGGLSTLYRWLVNAGTAAADFTASLYGWMPIIGEQVERNRDRMHELKDGLDRGGEAGANAGMKIWGGLNKVDTAASSATVKVESLSEAIGRMAGENISAEQANIRLEEAIDRATEAGKKNNAGIDSNTAKGRANRQALIDVATAANSSAEAIFKQTGSQELASAATARGREKFIAAARAMGVEKGEAIALANKLFAIPKDVRSKITVTANTQPAIDSAKSVVARINNMHARIRVSAEPSGGYGGSAHTGDGYSTGMAEGGIVTGPGPKGVDSVWRKLAPGEGVLTAREVDALGGPAAFMQLRAAVRGGQTALPQAASSGGGSGGRGGGMNEGRLAAAVAREVGRALSKVTLRIDDRTGNYATLLSRGDG